MVHRTGAPPPEEATTLHCSPAGCTWLTMASSVLQSPDGPSQLPALTLCENLAFSRAQGSTNTLFRDSTSPGLAVSFLVAFLSGAASRADLEPCWPKAIACFCLWLRSAAATIGMTQRLHPCL